MMQTIAIDSNILTLFLKAISPDYNPDKEIEKNLESAKAVIRIFLYTGLTFIVPPTVEKECLNIPNDKVELGVNWKKNHLRLQETLLQDWSYPVDSKLVEKRKSFYSKLHNKGVKDCQILAEAELAGIDILLTADEDFCQNIKYQTNKIKVMTPIEYWSTLKVPNGAQPANEPDSTNSLRNKGWWLW